MPGKAQNSGFEDAATRKPCLESPHEPRQRQNQLAVQSQSRAPEVWLSMQIFQVVEDLGRFKARLETINEWVTGDPTDNGFLPQSLVTDAKTSSVAKLLAALEGDNGSNGFQQLILQAPAAPAP